MNVEQARPALAADRVAHAALEYVPARRCAGDRAGRRQNGPVRSELAGSARRAIAGTGTRQLPSALAAPGRRLLREKVTGQLLDGPINQIAIGRTVPEPVLVAPGQTSVHSRIPAVIEVAVRVAIRSHVGAQPAKDGRLIEIARGRFRARTGGSRPSQLPRRGLAIPLAQARTGDRPSAPRAVDISAGTPARIGDLQSVQREADTSQETLRQVGVSAYGLMTVHAGTTAALGAVRRAGTQLAGRLVRPAIQVVARPAIQVVVRAGTQLADRLVRLVPELAVATAAIAMGPARTDFHHGRPIVRTVASWSRKTTRRPGDRGQPGVPSWPFRRARNQACSIRRSARSCVH